VHRDLIPLRRRPFCVSFLCLLYPVSERGANIKTRYAMLLSLSGTVLLLATIAASGTRDDDKGSSFLGNAEDNAKDPIDQGRHTFRFDTYGEEAFWTDQLQIQQSIQHLTPPAALALGLRVDIEALLPSDVEAMSHGRMTHANKLLAQAMSISSSNHCGTS
jgi:hypothetical protein